MLDHLLPEEFVVHFQDYHVIPKLVDPLEGSL